jgi:hypothetical protein
MSGKDKPLPWLVKSFASATMIFRHLEVSDNKRFGENTRFRLKNHSWHLKLVKCQQCIPFEFIKFSREILFQRWRKEIYMRQPSREKSWSGGL